MASKKFSLYPISVLFFMFLLPMVSIWIDVRYESGIFGWAIIGKWFIFWALGLRLFIAGVRQCTNPAFTAKQIFNINNDESFPVIRELGFANICLGLISIISLFNANFREPAAIGGGLYFGLAGFLHVFKKPASKNEVIALFSDFFIFLLMLVYLFFTAFIDKTF
jgi:hypothetical protein